MKKSLVLGTLAIAAAMPASVFAHHSYAMFDHTKEVVLKGTVKEWQWTSPHTWLYMVVPNPKGGEPLKYSVEGGNPGLLRRQGFTKGSLAPGDKVTVYMSPLKSGQNGGAIDAVQLANGKLLGERNKIAGAPSS